MRLTAVASVLLVSITAAAESGSPPGDIELALRSECVVLAQVENLDEKRDPAGRILGTLAVQEWLKGQTRTETGARLLLRLAPRTSREGPGPDEEERYEEDSPPAIPVGEPRIFFLRRSDAPDVWELTDAHAGMRAPDERDHLTKVLGVAAHPMDFVADPDAEVRASAAWALAWDARPADAPMLLLLLRDPDPNVGFSLLEASAISRLDARFAGELEHEAMVNPDPELRARMVELLGGTVGISREMFLAGLQDEDNGFRAEILLAYDFPRPGDAAYGEIVPALIRAMRNPSDEELLGPVSDLAGTLLEITGESLGAFRLQGDGSYSYEPDTAEQAAELAERWEMWWQEVLRACTANPFPLDAEGRRAAKALIAQLGDPDSEKRDVAQRELLDLGEPVAILLHEASEAADAEIQYRAQSILTQASRRRTAVHFAEQCGIHRSLEFLAGLAEHPDPRIARRADSRLLWLTGRTLGEGEAADWKTWTSAHTFDLEWDPDQGKYVPR